jgi:hypothetical protein
MALSQSAVSYPNIPIDAEEEIRVLEVQPVFVEGRYDETLRCTLVVRQFRQIELHRDRPYRYDHPADNPAWFEALSYTWGSWIDCPYIMVNGQHFRVTRNLFLALRRLRRHSGIRRLWVDQVCINQQASDERASQVRRMGTIYSLASRVVIWLGESSLPLSERSTPMYYSLLSQLTRALRSTTPIWWTRAWVIQERLLASWHPQIQFGPVSVTWDRVRTLVSPTSHVPHVLSLYGTTFHFR